MFDNRYVRKIVDKFRASKLGIGESSFLDSRVDSFLSQLEGDASEIVLPVQINANESYISYSRETYDFHNISFAQEGEDLILSRIFHSKKNGFYVDVGAHHPQRFSNTYLFYLQGWRGINIDAMPGSMEKFKQIRPEDINLEAGISSSAEELTYYVFNESALNTFSESVAAAKDGLRDYKIIDRVPVKTCKLSDILDRYVPEGQEIDFFSIDVEGLDYQALLSNDWVRYRPRVVVAEELCLSLEDLTQRSSTYYFLREKGYELFAKTFNSFFYKLIVA